MTRKNVFKRRLLGSKKDTELLQKYWGMEALFFVYSNEHYPAMEMDMPNAQQKEQLNKNPRLKKDGFWNYNLTPRPPVILIAEQIQYLSEATTLPRGAFIGSQSYKQHTHTNWFVQVFRT